MSTTSTEGGFDRIPWRISDAVLVLAPLPLSPLLRFLPDLPLLLVYAFSSITPVWMIGCSLWLARRRAGRLPPPPKPKRFAIEVALALPLALWVILVFGLASAAMAWLTGGPVVSRNQLDARELASSSEGSGLSAFLVVALVIDPIAEQLAFCGVVFNALRRRLPLEVTAIVLAVPFALLRTQSLVAFVATAFVGTAFVVAYSWRKQIVGAIATHVFVNCIGFLAARAAGPPPLPWIGVDAKDPEVRTRITEVVENSPAAAAGLQLGDVIRTLDGEPIDDLPDLKETVRRRVPGEEVIVAVERDGVLVEIPVTIGGR